MIVTLYARDNPLANDLRNSIEFPKEYPMNFQGFLKEIHWKVERTPKNFGFFFIGSSYRKKAKKSMKLFFKREIYYVSGNY